MNNAMPKDNLIATLDQHLSVVFDSFQSGNFRDLTELLFHLSVILSQRSPDLESYLEQTGLNAFLETVLGTPDADNLCCSALSLLDSLFASGSPQLISGFANLFHILSSFLEHPVPEIVSKTILCISHFARSCSSSCVDFPFDTTMDRLLAICDSFSELRQPVLILCASVIEFFPKCYLVNELISTGFAIFGIDLDPTEFFHAIRVAIRVIPVELVQYLKGIDNLFVNLASLILADCPLSEIHSGASMRLFLAILTLEASFAIEAMSYIDFDEVICAALQGGDKVRIAAYRLLDRGLRTRSSITASICEANLIDQFPNDIENGGFSLRISVVSLVGTILKYSRFDPRTEVLLSPGFLEAILDLLDAGSPQLDLAVLECVAKLVDDAIADRGGEGLGLVTTSGFMECLDEFAGDEACSARAIVAETLRAKIAGILESSGCISESDGHWT
jgi:hypothetical protein